MPLRISGLRYPRTLAGDALVEPASKPWSTRSGADFETRPGFCVGVVMTTRPFPYVRSHSCPSRSGYRSSLKGHCRTKTAAICISAKWALDGDQLVTAGYHGWTMVVTGWGDAIADAQSKAYELAGRVVHSELTVSQRYRRRS